MTSDEIAEISIDGDGRLLVCPQTQDFAYIYREAMEVGWDRDTKTLFSPIPREWSHLKWFQQILAAAAECNVRLNITADTRWTNVSPKLRAEIEAAQRAA